jgi:UDPglucose 6-dehydrogenase
MRIAVIGTGYVGLVTSVVMSELGHQVIGLDIDNKKIQKLNQGKCPIYEPGLEALINKHLNNKLTFTTSYQEAINSIEVVFICVGTPPKKDGSYDSSFVFAAAKSIAQNLKNYAVVVIKSTVPPSTTGKVEKIIREHTNQKFDVASVPEFLREGQAVNDSLNPARTIIGVSSNKAARILEKVHQKLKAPVLIVSPQSAQLTKYASNAMLATRISFINAIANICDKANADIKDVSKGLGLDPRIGQSFLEAGLGYGGSCFPKDTWALISYADSLGYNFDFLKQVDQVNLDQIKYFVNKIESAYQDGLKGKIITILGLSFKANTDDLREARSIPLIKELQKLGAIIYAYDPVAMVEAKKMTKGVKFFDKPELALINSNGLVLVTEWQEFNNLNFKSLKRKMNQPFIFDGRNFLDQKKLIRLGFKYFGVGR